MVSRVTQSYLARGPWTGHTSPMEPEAHAEDRALLLADRHVVAVRVQRDVDAALAAAAEAREAFLDYMVARLRVDARLAAQRELLAATDRPDKPSA